MEYKNIFKKIKNSHNLYLILILLVGVVFMVFPSGEKEVAPKESIETISYEEDLEYILSQIDGVGAVKVMLTYASTFEKSIAYETNQNNNQKKDGDSIITSELVSESSAVLSSGEPFVIKNNYPKVQGVIVVADGADKISIKQDIINAVSTALGIAPHKVFAVKKTNK